MTVTIGLVFNAELQKVELPEDAEYWTEVLPVCSNNLNAGVPT
jgi:hypothetical protein